MWERPEAVLFDLFGTLTPGFSRLAYGAALDAMADALGDRDGAFAARWRDTIHDRMTGGMPSPEDCIREVCEAIGLRASDAAVEAARHIRVTFARRTLAPRPDAVTTLRALRDAGVRLALVSDCSPEVPLLWPELPYASLIEVPVFSCAVRARKPDERMYRTALDGLAAEPARCVYVGDGGGRELTGASGLGMRAIQIRERDHDDEVFRVDAEDWPGEQVRSLAEVLGLLGLP